MDPRDIKPAGSKGTWRALVQGFAWLAGGELAARLLGLIAVLVMARQLGPGAFGVVGLGVTLLVWFRLVVDGGTEVLSMRDIARSPESFGAIAGPVLGLRLALSLAGAGLFVVAAVLLAPDSQDAATLALFALALPMIAANPRFMVLGVSGSNAVALGNIASQLLLAAGVVAVVNDANDGPFVALLYAGAEFVYALVVLAVVGRRVPLPRPGIHLRRWWEALRAGLPLIASNLARTIVYSGDILLITVILDSYRVGLYVAAQRPMLFALGMIGLFTTSFLASYSAADSERSRELFIRSVRMLGLVSVVSAAVLSVAAGMLVTTVFGHAYQGAGLPLAILAWAIPLIAVASPYSAALISHNRQSVVMRISGIAAGANLLANLAVIPAFGIRGAACTTVLSFGLILVLTHRSSVRLGIAHSILDVVTHRGFLPRPATEP